ncbi:VWA domain-containing protein [Rhodococcus hoagii]|nr:VWA domain-containing protein [Prescottella equi]
MFSSTLGSNYTASNGVWQNSRVNPPLPSRCGLDIAVVLDLSASVGATNLPILKSATDQLVDAFVGTPSRMAVFGFARYSPNQNATTNEIYPNHLSCSRSRRRRSGRIQIAVRGLGLGSGTNWDHALYRVATSGVHYDATIVLTDGNPTRWGLQGPPSPRPATGRTRISRTSRRRSSRPTS